MEQAEGEDRAELRWGDLACALLVAALLTRAALIRGPWLDEFWTGWLTDPQQGAGSLIGRWLSDQHPALFSLFVHTSRAMVGGSIELQRVVVNGFGLAIFFAATALFIRRTPRHAAVFRVFALVFLTLPVVAEGFADLRSYFLQTMACAIWLQFVFHALALDRDRPVSRLATGLGCIATFVMIATHFVGGVEGVLLYLGGALALFPRRRRESIWTGGAALAACVFLLISAALQVPRWMHELDFRWVSSSTADAIGMFWTIALAVVWSGFPIVVAALAGRLRPGESARRYQIAIAAAVAISVCAVLTLNQLQSIAVPRYLVPISVALSAVVAAGAGALWSGSLSFRVILMVWALGCGWWSSARAADNHGWYLGGAEIARLVTACPTTRVIAISGWAFGPQAGTHSAWREEPVFALGYRTVAARYGFKAELVSLPRRRDIRPVAIGVCPTVLWAEHILWSPPAGQEFAMAGLRAPPGTVFEHDTNTWGDLIIIARRPPAP